MPERLLAAKSGAANVRSTERVTDVFEEVDESLRTDKALELWRKYSPWLAVLAALVILSVAGYKVWQYFQEKQIEADARAFAAAQDLVDKKDLPGAKAALTKIAAGGTGFSALANHVLAGMDSQNNDTAAAGKDLEAAAKRNDGLFADIATLKLAYLKADTVSLADLQTIVAPLEKKGGELGALARELVAAKEFAAGDLDKARLDYQSLSLDLDAPPAMQQRVGQALAIIGATKQAAASSPASSAPPAAAAVPAPAAPAPAATGKKPQ